MIDLKKELDQDYYDFTYKGIRYYRVFYNSAPINKKCICGHVKADIETRFIAMDYIYSDGSKTKVIVPDDENLKSLDRNGNPVNSICLIDSETFFLYFIPARHQQNIFGKDEILNDNWKYHKECISFIFDHIFEKVLIDTPDGPSYIFPYKKDILDKLDDIGKKDNRINHIIHRGSYDEDGLYDISINRHNLYFLNDNEDYDYIKEILLKVYKEVKDNHERRSYEEFQNP